MWVKRIVGAGDDAEATDADLRNCVIDLLAQQIPVVVGMGFAEPLQCPVALLAAHRGDAARPVAVRASGMRKPTRWRRFMLGCAERISR